MWDLSTVYNNNSAVLIRSKSGLKIAFSQCTQKQHCLFKSASICLDERGWEWEPWVKWYPEVTSWSANQNPRLSSLLLSCSRDKLRWGGWRRELLLLMLLLGRRGPGHARLTSGAVCVSVHIHLIFCCVEALILYGGLLIQWAVCGACWKDDGW